MTKTSLTRTILIVALASLAACTGQKKKDEEGKDPAAGAPPPAATGASGGPSATGAVPAGTEAAEAKRDGAGGATTPSPVACATQSAPRCDAGMVDGCTGGLTSVHVCVASDAKAGEPCAQGAALTCATGQVDACTFAPPYASSHICVVVPRPAP